MFRKKVPAIIFLLALALIAAACAVPPVQIVEVTREVPVEVTRVVEVAAETTASQGPSPALVQQVRPAPVAPDGQVAGRFTDIVIELDSSLDPAAPGRALMKDKTIRVTLPADFVFESPDEFPVANIGSSPDCVPGNILCSTGELAA